MLVLLACACASRTNLSLKVMLGIWNMSKGVSLCFSPNFQTCLGLGCEKLMQSDCHLPMMWQASSEHAALATKTWIFMGHCGRFRHGNSLREGKGWKSTYSKTWIYFCWWFFTDSKPWDKSPLFHNHLGNMFLDFFQPPSKQIKEDQKICFLEPTRNLTGKSMQKSRCVVFGRTWQFLLLNLFVTRVTKWWRWNWFGQ